MFIRDDVYTFFKAMLEGINYFFVIYMVIYSVFLFVSVVSGSVKLYSKRKQECNLRAIPQYRPYCQPL